MDRLERLMDLHITDHLTFSDEHKKLLTAQVVLTDRVDKLGERVDKLAGSVEVLREVQLRTDERIKELNEDIDKRLSALISAVGKIVGRLPGL